MAEYSGLVGRSVRLRIAGLAMLQYGHDATAPMAFGGLLGLRAMFQGGTR